MHIRSKPHIAYFDFWDKVCYIEYNQDTHEYVVKEVVDGEIEYYQCAKEKELFRHMDDNGICFIGDDNPLGAIFQSYSAAYLAVVRWAADVAYAKAKYNALLEG